MFIDDMLVRLETDAPGRPVSGLRISLTTDARRTFSPVPAPSLVDVNPPPLEKENEARGEDEEMDGVRGREEGACSRM